MPNRSVQPISGGADPSTRADPDSWTAILAPPLPLAEVAAWVPTPASGAVVQFLGTVRDHSEGRTGVTELAYEAFVEECEVRLARLVSEARRRWPSLERVAALHTEGTLGVGEAAVVVSVSAPHRDAAFEAGRYLIDTLKATLPIWKRERWAGGDDWSEATTPVTEIGAETR